MSSLKRTSGIVRVFFRRIANGALIVLGFIAVLATMYSRSGSPQSFDMALKTTFGNGVAHADAPPASSDGGVVSSGDGGSCGSGSGCGGGSCGGASGGCGDSGCGSDCGCGDSGCGDSGGGE